MLGAQQEWEHSRSGTAVSMPGQPAASQPAWGVLVLSLHAAPALCGRSCKCETGEEDRRVKSAFGLTEAEQQCV
jgi:hypothetical protein